MTLGPCHRLPVSILLWLHSLILRMTLWLPGNIIFPLMSIKGFVCVSQAQECVLLSLRPITSLDIRLPEQQLSSQLFPHTSTSPSPLSCGVFIVSLYNSHQELLNSTGVDW